MTIFTTTEDMQGDLNVHNQGLDYHDYQALARSIAHKLPYRFNRVLAVEPSAEAFAIAMSRHCHFNNNQLMLVDIVLDPEKMKKVRDNQRERKVYDFIFGVTLFSNDNLFENNMIDWVFPYFNVNPWAK